MAVVAYTDARFLKQLNLTTVDCIIRTQDTSDVDVLLHVSCVFWLLLRGGQTWDSAF